MPTVRETSLAGAGNVAVFVAVVAMVLFLLPSDLVCQEVTPLVLSFGLEST